MKKRLTNTVKVIVEIKDHPKLFIVPQNQADGLVKMLEDFESKDKFVSSDAVFEKLDKLYTKPGAVLQGARLKEELTQIELAKKLNITQGDLSKMEAGKRTIGKAMAKRLAKILNIDYRIFL
jgi:ribosome-binding protein aMBF1 (putative translation factor)